MSKPRVSDEEVNLLLHPSKEDPSHIGFRDVVLDLQDARAEIKACHIAIANCNACSTDNCNEETQAIHGGQGVCECQFCASEVAEAREIRRRKEQADDR